ncbi:MAG: hypothetical protein KAH31_02445 [Candidatus Sabulitectum sp.]|nr:hypothetical protein [Candidatus Sabulitectum sp.]
MNGTVITEIGKEIYHFKSSESDLHRNIYLKRFLGADGSAVNMIMDPGTSMDVPILAEVMNKLIGGTKNIDLIFLSHQDPDVASNTHFLLASSPDALVVTSTDTFRLVRMYGIPEKNFFLIDGQNNRIPENLKQKTEISFISAEFCHFKGAMMFYDYQSRILFTGDFLGGINTRLGDGIYANEESFSGISLFHQIYMPSNTAIKHTVDRILQLNPKPTTIAPQHGDVISGRNVPEFLKRISKLDVGVDLAKVRDQQKETCIPVLNSILDTLMETYPHVYLELMSGLKRTGSFTPVFQFSGNTITEIKTGSEEALIHLWEAIKIITPQEKLIDIASYMAEILEKYRLPVPPGVVPKT